MMYQISDIGDDYDMGYLFIIVYISYPINIDKVTYFLEEGEFKLYLNESNIDYNKIKNLEDLMVEMVKIDSRALRIMCSIAIHLDRDSDSSLDDMDLRISSEFPDLIKSPDQEKIAYSIYYEYEIKGFEVKRI